MNRKSILGLLMFGCLVIAGLFYGVTFMIGQELGADSNQGKIEYAEKDVQEKQSLLDTDEDQTIDYASEEPWLTANPSDTDTASIGIISGEAQKVAEGISGKVSEEADNELQPDSDTVGIDTSSAVDTGEDSIGEDGKVTISSTVDNKNNNNLEGNDQEDSQTEEAVIASQNSGSNAQIDSAKETSDNEAVANSKEVADSKEVAVLEIPVRELIYDSTKIDYMDYIPEKMVFDSALETVLDINNPSINIKAKAAIVFDAKTKEILYHKNAVSPVFPASTVKLLTALVALEWTTEADEITIGDEVKMVASDSTKAYLSPGQVLTVRNLLEGMLLPSGNDAAYAIAAFVGRRSLQNPGATKEDAVTEFTRLMNAKAKQLGAKNSLFKTPDGYDAIGQYTTAYDMGLIGLAAIEQDIILEITKKSSSANCFVSGEEKTWLNTNALIKKSSGRYYPNCIGLKTGTSTMAGRCLISAGRREGREVVVVIMNSTSAGRWDDSTKLLEFGLK